VRPADPRVRRQLGVARGPLIGVVAAGLATSLAVIGQAFALTWLVVSVVRGDPVLAPALVLAGVFAVKAATGAAGELAAARAASRVSADMRRRLVATVLAGEAASMPEGELTTLATRGVSAAEPYLTRYLPALVLAGVLPVLTVVTIATQDLLSAVIVLATLPLVPVFGALVGMATRDRAAAQWRAMASLSGHFVDVMRGLPTLVAFRRARAQSATIRAITNRYREATVRTLRIAFASSAVLELVATLSVALVAVTVGVRLAAGHLDLRTGLVVLLLAPEAYWPLRRVGAEFHTAAEGVATFEQMSELPEPAAAACPSDAAVAGSLLAFDVSYTYDGRSTPALARTTIEFAPRKLTVVVGPSGCGKSTLIELLAGLREPATGAVYPSRREVPAEDWQTQVAWIPQRPSFLAGSVAENLRLAAPEASDEELWAALTRVALSERVRVLGGLEAAVGEDAQLLSAGERARLALARVVVARRPWVLLDEPTAHLDPVTQQVLLDVIVELSRDAGVIVVAHDPAVAAAADRIVTLAGPIHSAPRELGSGRLLRSATSACSVLPETPEAPETSRPGFALSTLLGVLASLSGVALTATAGWLIVKAAEQPPVLTMLVAIVGVRAFGLGRPVFRYTERLRSHDIALRLLAERRVEVYDTVVPLTPGSLGKRRGDLLATVVEDVDAVVDRELRVRLPVRTYLGVALIATALATWLLPIAGIVLGATSFAGSLTAYAITRRGCAHAEQELVEARADLSARVLEAAHLAREARMWQAQDAVLAPIAALGARLGRASSRTATLLTVARGVVQLSIVLAVALISAAGSDALAAGRVSAPTLALLLLLPVALGDVALGVVEAGALVGRIRAAEARLDRLSRTTPAVHEPPVPAAAPGSHALAVESASLGWDGRRVLDGLDFTLGQGERVAVVGPSGCGKSALAATLLRFVDPIEGRVRIGDRSMRDLALDDVRGRIGYVDDDPHVFATTLVENVRLARPDASDDEVHAALREARLGPWLAALPHGLDTWLGDGHAQVSGGERARLGLARSLLLDQPVLVLDEPVAHLDRDTAELLAGDLLLGSGGRSVVWITHSDIGLDRMDRVIDLG
jgi:ATP-binding cassette subfamily C protein CydCD